MAAATIVVRGTLGGTRVNWGLERARREGLKGTYWIKWKNGNTQKWDGPHHSSARMLIGSRGRGRRVRQDLRILCSKGLTPRG